VKGIAVALGCAAVLGAAQAWLRPPPAAPAAGDGAGSALSVLAGAVRPLFVAIAWADANAAIEDHRVLDALDRLRLLESADPAGWEASWFRAHLIAHNLAEREPPAARAGRVVEALGILEAAARRTRDPGPDVARGQLLLEGRLWEPDLGSRVARALGASPRAAALGAFEEAARRAPGSRDIRALESEAARLAALEALAAGGPLEDSQAGLDRAAATAAGLGEATLSVRLARAWAPALEAARRGSAEAIDRAGKELLSVLGDCAGVATRSSEIEAVLAASFARRAVPLAEERLRGGDEAAALSLLELVHKIRSFVSDRFLSSHAGLVRDLADRARVHGLLDSIASRNPALQARVSALRQLVSSWR
jgi:hypothetical protein